VPENKEGPTDVGPFILMNHERHAGLSSVPFIK